MHVNPYGEDPVKLAVQLINRPVASAAELEEVCRDTGIVIERPVGTEDLRLSYQMLHDWLAVVDQPEPVLRAESLNELLARSSTYPSLTNHDGRGWHLHYRENDLALWQILRTLVYVGTALHLAGRGMHRLGRCQAADCTKIYADFSRPGSQRYCSPSCANRSAVRRHRAQHFG